MPRATRAPIEASPLNALAPSAACPAEVFTFGDLEDPESRVARLAKSPRAMHLLGDLGTQPGVIYLEGGDWGGGGDGGDW